MIYSIHLWQEITFCERIEGLEELDRYQSLIFKCENSNSEVERIINLCLFIVIDVHYTHIVYSVYKKLQLGDWEFTPPSQTTSETLTPDSAKIGLPTNLAQQQEEFDSKMQQNMNPLDIELHDYTVFQDDISSP
jgi:hypothetical protein